MAYRITLGNRGYGGALLVSLSLVVVVCNEPNESFRTTSSTQNMVGTLSRVIVEGRGRDSGTHYFLRNENGLEVHELTFTKPPTATTGTKLSVTGSLIGSQFRVAKYSVLGREATRINVQPLVANNTSVTRSVGIVAIDANDGGVTVTNDTLKRLILGTDQPGPLLGLGMTDKSTLQYYDEVSYKGYHLRGDTEGPMHWEGSACVGGANDAAFVLRNNLSSSYDSYVWFFGTVDEKCGYAWGEEGTWHSPAQNSWYNGRFDATVFSHELGHNIGLMHSSSILCDGTSFADDPNTCTSREYGSPYSVMGSGGIRHLNAIEKWYLTWLSGCNGVRVRQSGTWTLLPLELQCDGVQALQIPMTNTARTFSTEQAEIPTPLKYYYLELRTSRGLDTGMTPEVLVHVSDDISPPTLPCARTAILDMDPTTATFDGLREGQSYTDPAGEPRIHVDRLNDDRAMVTVTMLRNIETSECLDGTTLVGPGPDDCKVPFVADGVGGAYCTSGEDACSSNQGGRSTSLSTTLGGYSTDANGVLAGSADKEDNSSVSSSNTHCTSSAKAPHQLLARPGVLATLTVLILIVGRRKHRKHHDASY